MKKVSAFSVFKGKKDKGDTPTIERNSSKRGSIKKASSEPVINGEDDSKSKKLLRAIKGGSFRNTVRGNKHRPTILADGSGNSPFVAGDSSDVKLTAVKGKNKKEESVNTSINGTPALPKKTKKSKANVSTESLNGETLSSTEQNISLTKKQSKKQVTPKQADTSKSNKQKKTLPPLPIADFTSTPSTSMQLTNEETASASKRKGKRELDDSSPNTSMSKKKRVESPKQTPVQPVNPQRKDKINKRKLMPNAVLETVYDSTEEARKLFECMIHPVQTDKFFKELWQKKPLLVRRHISNYNDGWFSTEEFDKILETEHIEFGVNLDVTSYTDGKRETHNPPGRAYRSVIWDYYQNGCSVRMLNPQTYSKNVWKMLSTLQEYFGCCVGANVYLTPPGTQGFAPHYDDIEAFILQLEGKKHWRLYNPLSEAETLPRESSGNFDESEIGSPILNVTLQAGDLLYFPRGTIHQGYALEDAHSLHITFSCYQKNTWGDLFQKLVPRALEIAIEEDVEFREGLPIDYLQYTGVVNSDQESTKRDAFTQKISSLLTKMIQNYCPIDSACDQLGKQYIRDSLPPVFSEVEKSCSVHGHGEKWDPASCTVKGNTEVEPDTMIKLIRKGCLRLITEDDSVRVYHNIENARVYHGRELQFIDITADLAPAVEFLIHSYPEYTTVDSLPAASVEDRVEVASLLYDKGLLITGKKEPDLKDANNNENIVSNVDNHTKDDAENEDTLNQKNTGKSGNEQKENSTGKSGNGLQLNENCTGKSGNELQQNKNGTGKSGNGLQQNENCTGKSGNDLQWDENGTGRSGNDLQWNENGTGRSGNDLQWNENGTGRSGNELQQNKNGMFRFVNELQESDTIRIYVTNRSPIKNSCINLQENSLHNQQNSMYSFGTVQTRNTELSQLSSTDGNKGLMHGMPKRIMLPDDQNEDMYQAGHEFSMVPGKQNTGMVPLKQIEHWIPDGQGLLMARAEQTNRRLPAEQNENMFQAGHQFSMVPGKQNTGMVPLKQIEHWTPEGQRFMMAMAEQETNRRVPVEQEVNREQTEKSQGREPVEEDGRMLLGRGIENMVPSLLDIEPVKQKCVRAVAKEDGENVEKSEINFRMQADTLMRPDELKEENKSDLKEISVKKEEDFVMFQEDNWTKCNFCPFKSKYKNNVIRHCSVKHNQHAPSYPCCYCDFTSTIMSSVKRHIYLKHKDKENIFQTRTFKCNLCNAIVSTKNDLDEHRKQIHKFMPIKYMCSDCPFETERCDSLVMHQRVIHKKTHFYCCSKCSECFSGAIDYENHVCKARPSRIKCHLCEKTFSSAKCVQAHMKTHSGQGLYFCDKCDKKFSKLYQLQRHHNISHEKKVFYFKCEDCSSSFLYKSSLKRHMKIAHLAHVNADRKRFLRRRRNCGEIRHVDRKVKKYKCPKCLCAFHVEGTLERHMILRHSDALAAEHPVPVMDMQSLTNNAQSSSRLCTPGPYFIDSDTDFLAEESLLQQRNTEDSSQQDRSVYCWKTEYLL